MDDEKLWKNLICYSCIFNLQPHVHLKKWTLKFKLLYTRNCISYFNKICSVCCVNTHIKSLKVWLKFVLSWLKYSIFSRALFFIGTPCIYSGDVSAGPVSRGGEVSIRWMPVCSRCVRAVLCAGTSVRSEFDDILLHFLLLYMDKFIVKRSRELTSHTTVFYCCACGYMNCCNMTMKYYKTN